MVDEVAEFLRKHRHWKKGCCSCGWKPGADDCDYAAHVAHELWEKQREAKYLIDLAEQQDQGRIVHIRAMCVTAIERDPGPGLTDRAWLAQSVLNILDGTIDAQIMAENART